MNGASDTPFKEAVDLMSRLQRWKSDSTPFHLIGQVFCDPRLDRLQPLDQLKLCYCALQYCKHLSGTFRNAGLHLILQRAQLILSQESAVLDTNHVAVFYEMARNVLFFSSDHEDFTPFDAFHAAVVQPVARVLRDQPQRRTASPRQGRPLRVGYLSHWATFARGQAVTPVIVSYARAHGRLTAPRHHVFVYPVRAPTSEFRHFFHGEPAVVRERSLGNDFISDARQLRSQIQQDRLDVLLCDLNTATETYLVINRAAPIQAYFESGDPFWDVGGIDYVLWIGLERHGRFPLARVPGSRLPPCLDQAFLAECQPTEMVAKARAAFPSSSIIAGTLGRKVKITPTFIKMMQRVMRRLPNLHWVVAGNGTNPCLDEAVKNEPLAGRVSVMEGHVDLGIYGRAIDFFLDTFPFVSGYMVVQLGFYGTPAVSMLAELYRGFQIETRDPELLVSDIDAYEMQIERLVTEPDYLAKRRHIARTLATRLTRTEQAARTLAILVEGLYDELAAGVGVSHV